MIENIQHLSRPWLESLSTLELIKQADTYGVDIPAGLDRIFIIEEILESSSAFFEQSNKQETDIVVNPSLSETALLPKRYNNSCVEVIIRDPLWAFVFWEIKENEREEHENAPDFKGYFLRVIPLDEKGEQQTKENLFTVTIDTKDHSRYLGFAEQTSENFGRFIIKLGAIRGGSEVQIASSQIFDLPKFYDDECLSELGGNALSRLSGVQDLPITKNDRRLSKNKRQQP